MVKVTRLDAACIHRLGSIERSTTDQPWVREVEDFVLLGGAASHLGEPRSAILLLELNSRQVIGAAVHHPHHAMPGVQYLSAILIDHRWRGKKLGPAALAATIDDARVRSGRPYVAWTVHPQNAVMLRVSRQVVASGEALAVDRNPDSSCSWIREVHAGG